MNFGVAIAELILKQDQPSGAQLWTFTNSKKSMILVMSFRLQRFTTTNNRLCYHQINVILNRLLSTSLV